jgi:hypothetical protein
MRFICSLFALCSRNLLFYLVNTDGVVACPYRPMRQAFRNFRNKDISTKVKCKIFRFGILKLYQLCYFMFSLYLKHGISILLLFKCTACFIFNIFLLTMHFPLLTALPLVLLWFCQWLLQYAGSWLLWVFRVPDAIPIMSA